MIHYAGIGARKTPNEVTAIMRSVGMLLAMRGYVLRSGGAIGADSAFEAGARSVNPRLMLRYIALNAERNPHWYEHAKQYHPAWSRLDVQTRQLMARNSAIMLNDKLDDPVRFVVCWTPDGRVVGGTGQALRIAADRQWNIPVFNLAIPGMDQALWRYVETLRHA
jgi:hypothetical protein